MHVCRIGSKNSSLDVNEVFKYRGETYNQYILSWNPVGVYWLRLNVNTVDNPFPDVNSWLLDFRYVKFVVHPNTGEIKYNIQNNGKWIGWKQLLHQHV